MLDAGVEAGKLRRFIQRLVPKMAHQRFQVGLDIHDIDQVAVLVQGGPFESHFDLIMMRVPLVFCAPIAANEEMLGDKVAHNGHSVHGGSPL